MVKQQCEQCGQWFEPTGLGRPPKYCTDACRQRAWALRTAARALQAEQDPRPKVVERVVQVEVKRPIPAEPAAVPLHQAVPVDVDGWLYMLARLREQLEDDRGKLAHEHWKHRALFDGIVLASTALGHAHPGGLDALQKQHRRR